MDSNSERLQVLKMVEQGNISAEEGIKRLEAVEGSTGTRGGPDGEPARWLRIRVSEGGRQKIKVNVPVSLLSVALRFIPKEALKGTAGESINPEEILEAIRVGAQGKIVEAEDEENHVEIYLE